MITLKLSQPMNTEELSDVMEAVTAAIRASEDTPWQPALYMSEPDAVGWDAGNRLALGLSSCQRNGSLRIGPMGGGTAFSRQRNYKKICIFTVPGALTACPCHKPVQLEPEEVTATFIRFFQEALNRR